MRARHAPDGFPPHALFRRRVRCHTVAADGLPASLTMRRRLIFLPVRRMLPIDGCGRGSGRFKPLATFLSLLRVNVQESPPILASFHFGPCTFNFIFGQFHFGPSTCKFIFYHDFCYISFDLVRLGHSIEIN